MLRFGLFALIVITIAGCETAHEESSRVCSSAGYMPNTAAWGQCYERVRAQRIRQAEAMMSHEFGTVNTPAPSGSSVPQTQTFTYNGRLVSCTTVAGHTSCVYVN